MFEGMLGRFQERLRQTLERWTLGRWWALRVALATTVAIVLISGAPSLSEYRETLSSRTWRAVMLKTADPTHNLLRDFGPTTNAVRVNFRLLMPLVARVGSLTPAGLLALQALAGVAMLLLAALLAMRITGSRPIAALVVLMVGCSYAGMTAFVELRGVFDGVSLLLLMCALYFRNPVAVALAVFLAGWNDERALMAVPLVALFCVIEDSERLSAKSLFSPRLLGLAGGIALNLATRLWYVRAFGIAMNYEGSGFGILANQINMIPMGIWTALEGGWLMVVGAALVLLQQKRRWEVALFVTFLAVLLLVAMGTVDVSRSTAYCLPAIFVSLAALRRTESLDGLWKLAVVACAVSLFWPGYYAGGKSTIWLVYPLPVQVFRWWLA